MGTDYTAHRLLCSDCVTDIGAAKGEGHGKSGRRGPLTAPTWVVAAVAVEVSLRVLIKISPLVHLRHILQRRVRVRSGSTLVELESSLSSHEPYRRVTRSVRADVFPHFRSSARARRALRCAAQSSTLAVAHTLTRERNPNRRIQSSVPGIEMPSDAA